MNTEAKPAKSPMRLEMATLSVTTAAVTPMQTTATAKSMRTVCLFPNMTNSNRITVGAIAICEMGEEFMVQSGLDELSGNG